MWHIKPKAFFLKAFTAASIIVFLILASDQLAAEETFRGTSFADRPTAAAVKNGENWMFDLSDDLPLSQLSIPGTHDTCAMHNGLSFGFAKCQSLSLHDQLKIGIRFLDIRCRRMGDRFAIFHGVIDQRMDFDEVQEVCCKFLAQHASECIIMSIKEESTPQEASRCFNATFAEYIKPHAAVWHRSASIPKLNRVRGKIVLIDRVGSLGGLPWQTLARQDSYDAPIDEKTKLIEKHFGSAIENTDKRWHLNYCSGTYPSKLTTPKTYATFTNRFAFDLLRSREHRKSRIGTIVMDFPGEDLVSEIIATNFSAQSDR